MVMQQTVEQRLDLETVRRAVNGTIPQIFMLTTMLTFTPSFPGEILYNIACCVSLTVLILRWFLFRKYKKDIILKAPWSIYLGLSTSFLWAIEIGLAIGYFGVDSLTGLFHVYFTCGILTNVMYSLSPTPKIQQIFILGLGLPVSFIIYFSETSDFRYSGGILAMFVIHLFFASRNHFSDLRSAYEFEEALSVENNKLQEVVDSVPGFMIVVSDKGKWLQSTRLSKDIINSKDLTLEIHEFQMGLVNKMIKELDLEIDGERHSFIVSFEKVHSFEGGIIIFGLPIDELKEVRQQLEFEKAKAAYSAKLAGIGVMASGVAHEINNPLAIISMNAETLRAKLSSGGVEESFWDKKTKTILETVGRIAVIIRSLQQLSREDVIPQGESVDLHNLIKEVINVSDVRLKQMGINLVYKNDKVHMVKGKHLEIGQVLMNLINNSVDAVKTTPEKKIIIEVREEGKEVVLDIMDSGTGISEEVETNLFQPFYTTKDVGTGIGLGLSISRSILLANQGSISLIKSKDMTTFQVRLSKP
jgi:signal transduction histidine kinase